MERLTLEVKNLLSFSAAATLLGVSRPTIYSMVSRNELHPITIGSNRYLLLSEVQVLVKEDSNKGERWQ